MARFAEAVPSPSATAPPRQSIASHRAEREALAERYPVGRCFVIRRRALATVADCGISMCLPWHGLTTHSKQTVVTLLFIDFGSWFSSAAQFSQLLRLLQLLFCSFSQVLQQQVLQGFANTFFSSFKSGVCCSFNNHNYLGTASKVTPHTRHIGATSMQTHQKLR